MKTIHKYTLTGNEGTIDVPAGGRVIGCQMQRHSVCVWCEVDDTAPRDTMRYAVIGTGQDRGAIDALAHVGTVIDGPYVWHVYVSARMVR